MENLLIKNRRGLYILPSEHSLKMEENRRIYNELVDQGYIFIEATWPKDYKEEMGEFTYFKKTK